MANSLNRDIEADEVVLLDPSGKKPDLTEYELLLRCNGSGFGNRAALRGTCIIGHWVDGTEPQGVRQEGSDILCSCRPELWICPSCRHNQDIYFKMADGRRRDCQDEPLVEGQVCLSCGKAFDESSWTCCATLSD